MKQLLLSSFLFLIPALFEAQITCGSVFTDSGGAGGPYSSGETSTYLIQPNGPNLAVQLDFTAFATEEGYDSLIIYDNNLPSGTVLGRYSGHTLPNISFIAENPTGCLTVVFISDGATIDDGWVANVTCITTPTCFRPIDLVVEELTHRTASVNWTSVNSETQWTLEYGPAGFDPGTGTTVTVTSLPYLIEGLDDMTSYDFYAKARCGGSFISSYSMRGNFTTNASPNPAYICGNLFTDEGGASDDYFNYANDTIIICPTTAGQHVSLVFTSFSTEEDYDSLIIYNGNSVFAPMIGSYDGDLNLGTITSTSVDGCLTAVFHSDDAAPSSGWSAAIVCAGGGSNLPPSAVNDNVNTAFNTPVIVNVLSNDSDADGNLLPATVNVTAQSANGTTSVNTTTGAITFTPTSGFSGITTFTYQVCDNGTPQMCASATVTVNVGLNGLAELVNQTSVYPNPAKDVLYVKSAQTIETLAVYSLEGKEINRFNGNTVLNVSSLGKGVYILESTFENGQVSRTQFIKE